MAKDPTDCGPILIADDDPAYAALLADVLQDAGYETVVVADGHEAVATARSRPPVLALLDVNMPGLSGYETCRRLRADAGDLPVMFVSGERVEPFDRAAGLLVGADDYVVKPVAADELLARVRAVLRRSVTAKRRPSPLTKREQEVLQLLAEGLDRRAVAGRLAISPRTVGTHIEHILEKLDVRNSAQAVAVAFRLGLIEPP